MLYNKSLTATVYIVNDDKVLLHMHKKYKTWFPVGGHLEPDELPHETALREAKEESGLNITLVDINNDVFSLGKVVRVPSPIAIYNEGIHHEEEFLDFIYVATTEDNAPEGNLNESQIFRWFSMDELLDEKEDIKIHIRNTAIRCLCYMQPLFSAQKENRYFIHGKT